MNYNARDDKNDSRALRDAEIDEGRNQEKSIKCWLLTRPLVSRKGQRERKGTSSRMASKLSLPQKSPKLDQSLKLSDYTAKEMVTRSGNALNIWWIRRMAKWTRVYLIYMLLMCTLLVFIVAPEYLILVRLLKISNSKQELQNKQKLVEGKVTMCVGSGSKIDMIIIAHSLYFRD